MKSVDFQNVTHFQAQQAYSQMSLFLGKEKLLPHCLAYYEKQLPDNFIRVHKSYLVNTDYIEKVFIKSWK